MTAGRPCYSPVSMVKTPTLLSAFTAAVFITLLPLAAGAAPSGEFGAVQLVTTSSGVPVFIDDLQVGETPLPGPWTLQTGAHKVELRPAGRAAVAGSVTITKGQIAQVVLLNEVRSAALTAEQEAAATRVIYTGPGFSLETAGYVALGLGVISGAAAAAFGISANEKAEEARALDRLDFANSRADQLNLVDDTQRAAFFSNVSMGVGLTAGLVGVTMLALASDGPLRLVFLDGGSGGTVNGALGGGVGGRF